MTEAKIVRDIVAFLKSHLTGVVLKHNDMRTAGIPDLSVTTGGSTWWFEVKFLPAWEDRCKSARLFSRLQLEMMRKLDNSGRARYLIVNEASSYYQRRLSVVTPQEVKYRLDTKSHLFFSPVGGNSAD